jgi:hypothetical protein
MHIAAYLYPLPTRHLPATFFYNANSCWGWGTWQRAWKHFRREPAAIKAAILAKPNFSQKNFNKGQGKDFYLQLEYNLSGKLYTWAVFWHSTIFLHDGLALHPQQSLTRNIGFDGTGANCLTNNGFAHQKLARRIPVAPLPLVENQRVIFYFRQYFFCQKIKKLWLIFYWHVVNRIIRLLKRLFSLLLSCRDSFRRHQ